MKSYMSKAIKLDIR